MALFHNHFAHKGSHGGRLMTCAFLIVDCLLYDSENFWVLFYNDPGKALVTIALSFQKN
jgi:hypothetical protein